MLCFFLRREKTYTFLLTYKTYRYNENFVNFIMYLHSFPFLSTSSVLQKTKFYHFLIIETCDGKIIMLKLEDLPCSAITCVFIYMIFTDSSVPARVTVTVIMIVLAVPSRRAALTFAFIPIYSIRTCSIILTWI